MSIKFYPPHLQFPLTVQKKHHVVVNTDVGDKHAEVNIDGFYRRKKRLQAIKTIMAAMTNEMRDWYNGLKYGVGL